MRKCYTYVNGCKQRAPKRFTARVRLTFSYRSHMKVDWLEGRKVEHNVKRILATGEDHRIFLGVVEFDSTREMIRNHLS